MKLLLAGLVFAVCGAGTGVSAQASWTGAVLPYEDASRGDRPTFAFATDPVVETIGIPPLRAVSLPADLVEIRVWVGFGVVIPHLLLRLRARGSEIDAEFVRWWGMMDHPANDPRFVEFLSIQRALGGTFGCNERQNGGEWTEVRLDRTRVQHTGWTFACRADFSGDEPNWSALFARLSSLGLEVLPDPRTLTPSAREITDGTSLEVEVLSGTEYRTYTYGNPDYQPWPEANRAQAIIEALEEVHTQGR